jgi:hypothetical protein
MRQLMRLAALSDNTFSRAGGRWQGRCLICNGRLGFDERTGVGANLEHILPRSRGGTNELSNLGLTHPGCNAEKGRNWDSRKGRRGRDSEGYARLLERLRQRRRERWRDPAIGSESPDPGPHAGNPGELWLSDRR